MFRHMLLRTMAVVACSLGISGSVYAQAVLGPSNVYTEDFDSMGAAGTVAPVGWRVYQIAGSSSAWTNTTGSNSLPAIGGIPNGTTVAGGTVSPGLVANNNPTGTQVNGYNATGASGAVGDRGIATAPSGIAGSAIELQITNNSGLSQTGLLLSYDIRRYQAGANDAGRNPPAGIPQGSEELPGYWLFYSLDNGANYTAVNSLIPVGEGPSSQPIVPNTIGVTNIAGAAVQFGSGDWSNGSTLFLRWVDDNAIDPSPDEIIGIDNIGVTAVPEPSGLICLLALALFAGRLRR